MKNFHYNKRAEEVKNGTKKFMQNTKLLVKCVKEQNRIKYYFV